MANESYATPMMTRTIQGQTMDRGEWNGEINAAGQATNPRWGEPIASLGTAGAAYTTPWTPADTRLEMSAGMGMEGSSMNQGMMRPPAQGARLARDMRPMVSDEVIEFPTTVNEAHMGSLKAMLLRNIGNYVVATFLIGTQNTSSWAGILYAVGNDFVTIYQELQDRYIVCDMYSLKYMEFYDVQRREQCRQLMQQNGNR